MSARDYFLIWITISSVALLHKASLFNNGNHYYKRLKNNMTIIILESNL